MKKPARIIIFLIGIVIILSVVKVVLYNRLSTSGTFVGKIEEEISSYKTQNAILSEKLLMSSSLTSLSAKAIALGFIRDDSSMVLRTLPVAIKQ